MDFSHLSARDQQILAQRMEDLQMKDMLNMFNGLVDRCFRHCVSTFRGSQLTMEESDCVGKCSEKFLKHQQRAMKAYITEQGVIESEAAAKAAAGGDGAASGKRLF